MEVINGNSTDAELWRAIQLDDQKAFRILFDRYWSTLYSTANFYFSDKTICEGIVQDIFLNIWLKRATLNILDFKPYLKTAARYQVYKEKKTLAKEPIKFTDEVLEFNSGFSLNEAEKQLILLDFKQQMHLHLANLPKRAREIFLLSREEQLSNAEIAEKLQISKRSVENKITLALQYLRMNFKNYFVVTVLTKSFLYHFFQK